MSTYSASNYLVPKQPLTLICLSAVGNLKAACAAVESYLLFDPADETMLQNKEYYKAQPKVKEEYFTSRQVIIRVYKNFKFHQILV